MNDTRSIHEIKEAIEAAELELAELTKEKSLTELKLKAINARMNELHNNWRGGGRIADLQAALSRAEAAEAYLSGRAVRVTTPYNNVEKPFAFNRVTAKRIYLTRDHCTRRFEKDGSSKYDTTIHPDDLAMILAGKENELPIVRDVIDGARVGD